MRTDRATHQTPQHVVVIGAGMVGLSTAWFLQREGVEVTVVDRHDVAAGASWGNAGWLAPALTLPLPEPAILATGIRATLSPSSPVYVPLTANPRLLRFLADFARHCTDKHWRHAMGVFNQANAVALDAYADLAAAPGDLAVAAPTKPATPFLAAFASSRTARCWSRSSVGSTRPAARRSSPCSTTTPCTPLSPRSVTASTAA